MGKRMKVPAQRWCPVRHVLFDLLYHAGRCRMRESLMQRRGRRAALWEKLDVPDVVFSPGVIGAGTAFYHNVVSAGHEGVVAKLQSSAYRPGKHTITWKKIKRRAGKE